MDVTAEGKKRLQKLFCFFFLLSLVKHLDLRAFEKRLTEIVNQLQPSMWRYRSNFNFFFAKYKYTNFNSI